MAEELGNIPARERAWLRPEASAFDGIVSRVRAIAGGDAAPLLDRTRLLLGIEQSVQRATLGQVAAMKRLFDAIASVRGLALVRITQATHFIQSEWVRRFVGAHPDLGAPLGNERGLLLRSRSQWQAFWRSLMKVLDAERCPWDDRTFIRRQLHSWALQAIPLASFLPKHPRWRRLEKEARIPQLPGAFLPRLQRELHSARSVELPIEAVSRISRTLAAVRMRAGEGDAISALLQRILMTQPIPTMYGFAKYLDFYLGGIDEEGLLQQQEQRDLDIFYTAVCNLFEGQMFQKPG